MGTTIISATINGLITSTNLTVTAVALQSISFIPASPTLAKNTAMPVQAIGLFSDMHTEDLTAQVAWNTTNHGVATVGAGMGVQVLTAGPAMGSTMLTATLGSVMGSTPVTVTNATIVSMSVTPPNPSIAQGFTQDFIAEGTFSDASKQILNLQATWASSATSVATVSNAGTTKGRATAGSTTGMTNISATFGGVAGSTILSVTAKVLNSISVTPGGRSIALGTTLQMTATGLYSDGSNSDITGMVTWSSSAPGVAAVDPNSGLVTSVAPNSATITATSGMVSGGVAVTVTSATIASLSVSKPALSPASIAAGTTQQFIATGTFSDATTQDLTNQVSWGTSAPGIATVAAGGLATGVSGTLLGTMATISASYNAVVNGMAVNVIDSDSLTVTSATLVSMAITPPMSTLPKGITVNLVATGTFSDGSTQNITSSVGWSTDAAAIATINDGGVPGRSRAGNVGTATITATSGLVMATATVTATPAVLQSITIATAGAVPASVSATGPALAFEATGHYSDGTTPPITSDVTWSSSDATRATISNTSPFEGEATGVAVGTTDITATLSGVSSTPVTLTVNP
jgi:hypothetical protein